MITDDVTYCCTVHVNYGSSFFPSIYDPQSNTSVFENQASSVSRKATRDSRFHSLSHTTLFSYSILFAPFPQSERLDQAIISNTFFTLLYPSCIYITPAGGGFCHLIYVVNDWRFISSGTILPQKAKSRGGTLVTRAYILRKALTVEMYSQKKSRFAWTWTARNR